MASAKAAPPKDMNMQTQISRPNRRPKLFLPLALVARPAEILRQRASEPFPLSPDQLRRTVAEMIG
jgi:hypothetical protein